MGEKKFNFRLNKTNDLETNKNCIVLMRLWERLQMNEWNFICLLFIVSLSIVLGKLYINYGK